MTQPRGFGLGARAAVFAIAAIGLFGWLWASGDGGAPPKSASAAETGKAGKSAKAKRKPKKKKKAKPVKIAGAFGSLEACKAALAARTPRAAKTPPRIGSWNIRWFPRGAVETSKPKKTDLDWLACTIASLDVDVLAVQEILQDKSGREALLDVQTKLDALTSGAWKAELDDCPGSGRQHVGLLFDSERVTVSNLRPEAGFNPVGEACAANLRPGFGALAKFADGSEVQIVSVHFDSGHEARDFEHRKQSLTGLGGAAKSATRKQGVVVIGDFNSMGCKTCEPVVDAKQELAALDEQSKALGFVRAMPAEGEPACTHYHGRDAGVLDLALVSTKPKDLSAIGVLEVGGACAALKCKQLKSGTRVPAFDGLSDHCPLVLQLGASKEAKPVVAAEPTDKKAAPVPKAAPAPKAPAAAPASAAKQSAAPAPAP